jgi:anti-sigma factor RsiW
MTTKATSDDCILIEHSLALWVGGDLEHEVQARVDRHLAQCERCSDSARSLESARRGLIGGLSNGQGRRTAGPDLWPGVRDALRREGILASAPAATTLALLPVATEVAHRAVPSVPPRARNRPRTLRFASVGMAAAAAVLVGFLLGRLGGHVAEPQTSPIASNAPTRASELVVAPSELAHTAHAVVPVSDGVRLRPLAPGEARLSDSVENVGADWWINPSAFGNPNAGSPASLQSAYPRRW